MGAFDVAEVGEAKKGKLRKGGFHHFLRKSHFTNLGDHQPAERRSDLCKPQVSHPLGLKVSSDDEDVAFNDVCDP